MKGQPRLARENWEEDDLLPSSAGPRVQLAASVMFDLGSGIGRK